MSGNAKMPGGYAFRTREEAAQYIADNPKEAGRYAPYEIELPGDDFEAVTVEYSAPDHGDCRALTVEAPFINPDTGLPV